MFPSPLTWGDSPPTLSPEIPSGLVFSWLWGVQRGSCLRMPSLLVGMSSWQPTGCPGVSETPHPAWTVSPDTAQALQSHSIPNFVALRWCLAHGFQKHPRPELCSRSSWLSGTIVLSEDASLLSHGWNWPSRSAVPLPSLPSLQSWSRTAAILPVKRCLVPAV